MKTVIEIYPSYEGQALHLELWQKIVERAHPLCLEHCQPQDCFLPNLDLIEISLVDDLTIIDVHAKFMDDPTPTDVITFHHGEILISLDTAFRQAQEHATEYAKEVALYMIHGLLHLAGWHDYEPTQRAAMHELQDHILEIVWT